MPVPGAVADSAAVVDSWVEIVAADGHRVPALVAEPAGMKATALCGVVATASWLRGHPRGNSRVASIGFCMGGRLSLLLATHRGVLDRAIDCWGGRITRRTLPPDELHPEVVVERISQLSCPLLGIFGDLDENPGPADVEELRSALLQHGKEHRIRSFAGAGHAFFADTRPSYREEQAHLAWKEFLDFLAPLRG